VARKVSARKGVPRKPSARKAQTEEASSLQKATVAVTGTIAGAVAAVKRTVSRRPPDALALLIADHRRMQELLEQGEKTTAGAASRRGDLLDTLTAELRAHELIEEKVLYPALKSHPEAKDLTLEAFQEHHLANVVVEELHRVAASDEEWGAKFTVLKENIEHHIQEEEGEMFRTARGVFSQEELDEMGARMAAMKAERGPE
jgi:hemerythrin-like domain-containing protein